MFLAVVENLWSQHNVAWFVNTVDVTECRSDGEVGANLGEFGMNHLDVFGVSVEILLLDRLIVDSVFLTSGDSDLHLEDHADLVDTLEVFLGGGDVLIMRFL